MARRDDVLAEHVSAWLTKAENDLRAAKADLAFDPPILSDVVFHSQQAAEKVLKGMLTAHQITFTKTHAIEELAPRILEIAPHLEPQLRRATRLTVYAWRYRYPGDAAEPPEAEALEALAIASALVMAVGEELARGGAVGAG